MLVEVQQQTQRTALVTGATGLLGRQVLRTFRESPGWAARGTGYARADGTDVLKVDLSEPAEVATALDEVKPSVVIHCAANRFPDKCDADPEGARVLNVAATGSLAGECAARGALLVYISTDYVFPGRVGEAPYETADVPAPTNLYGQTKLDGERAALGAYEDAGAGAGAAVVVLRVPVLYGEAESGAESAVNVLMDAVWKAQDPELEPGSIKMDNWALRYPTNTEDVGRVCRDIADKYLSTAEGERGALPRVLHFSSEDKMTKYEICELFGSIMGLGLEPRLVPNNEGNDPAAAVQRPYDCHLSTQALRGLGINLRTQNFRDWWRWKVGAFRK